MNDSLVFRPGPPPFTADAPTLPPGSPGGGGGGIGAVYNGHYGGGTPTQTPPPGITAAIAYDKDAPFGESKWDDDLLTWT